MINSHVLLDWLLGESDADDALAVAPALTYAELRADVRKRAKLLREECGARGGVLVGSERTEEGVASLLGVLASGLTAVLVPPDADPTVIEHITQEVGAVGQVGLGSGLPACGNGRHSARLAEEVAVVIYTSGTTALPKGVQLSTRNVLANAEGVSQFLGLRQDDVVSLVLPFQFSYGFSMLLVAIRARARLVLHGDFAFPARCVTTMRDQGTTVFAGVPFHYQQLLRERSGLRDADVPLRLVLSAGGAMTPEILAGLRGQVPQATPLVMYGQTEATARLSYLPPDELEHRPGSIGRGMPGIELAVRETSGRLVEPGEVGEVYAVGDSVMLGYVGDEAATAEVLTSWGLRTRDLATVDADGFIYLQGRMAEYAKVRGVRVSLPELENAVECLDEVVEALASVELNPGGEQIILEVRLRDGVSDHDWPDVRLRIRLCLSPTKRPARIERVAAVRRTTSGKKLRRVLRGHAPSHPDETQ